MFKNLEVFQLSNGLAQHATVRQGEIARNIANADTPGFRAKDTVSFQETLRLNTPDAQQRSTRAQHFTPAANGGWVVETRDAPSSLSPNGNSVSLETEMMKASETRHQHEMALSVYKSSMNILRASIGRR